MADNYLNGTSDVNKVVYTFSLSGSYGPLQRTNFYVILIFAVYYPYKTVLVKVATGAVMVFPGVTAIYAIALSRFAVRRRAVFEDDVVGISAILGTTSGL
jgi:hypothetical protein